MDEKYRREISDKGKKNISNNLEERILSKLNFTAVFEKGIRIGHN